MIAWRQFRILPIAVLALCELARASAAGRAAELVMFRQALCEWCEIWDDEIGPVYGKTPEGRRAPMRKVDIHAERPADLARISPVIYTPTFVLVHNGDEVGRILGYPGEDFFWGLLDELLEKLPAGG